MALKPAERGIRNLAHLMASKSSSRVLNLIRAHIGAEKVHKPLSPSMFTSPLLNKSFLIKHRLRPNERELFVSHRATATKIVIPIDYTNLGIGGKSVFIDQANFDKVIAEALGIQDLDGSSDVRLLRELDRIPSFDPFILKEWLARMGLEPDGRYFELTPSVIAGMEEFVVNEISLLVSMSLSGTGSNAAILKLVRKMLASHYDDDLEPLQQTLRMTKEQFRDGMFGWKGLLYYKWLAKRIEGDLPAFIGGITSIRPKRHITQEQVEGAMEVVKSIGACVSDYFNTVSDKVRTYDSAYRQLTRKQDPVGFRAFLLEAPGTFVQMGEYVGMLEHSVEFWKFRASTIEPLRFTGDEYVDLVLDLKDGLGA